MNPSARCENLDGMGLFEESNPMKVAVCEVPLGVGESMER